MTHYRIILTAFVLLLLALGLVHLSHGPAPSAASRPPTTVPTFHLGLIPERDIFQERHAYRALADYLQPKLGCQVDLVTNNSYAGILTDLENHQVDAAFLGSLVAALAVDRFQAQVILKSESPDHISTYAGTIFVLDASPIRSFPDLQGKTLGAVPTTTAGAVFPIFLMQQAHTPDQDRPKLVWAGTHDDVIREVVAGHLDAGAVKDLRLDAYERAHPDIHFRRLITSARVPDNALVVRTDISPDLARQLRLALLLISDDKKGGGPSVLAELGLQRYLPTSLDEYAGLYDMLDTLGPQWSLLGIQGPPPKKPATSPTSPSRKEGK